MKFSNFELLETKGTSPLDWRFFAEVDVETGFLFWKKKQREKIAREYAGYWFFMDSGKSTPGFQVEVLAKVWRVRTGQEC